MAKRAGRGFGWRAQSSRSGLVHAAEIERGQWQGAAVEALAMIRLAALLAPPLHF
jgi:hypothetical protein